MSKHLKKHKLSNFINRNKLAIQQRNHRWDIAITFLFVFILGVFYQLNRMDAFLHLSQWQNMSAERIPYIMSSFGKEWIPREKYLIVYDPANVQSVLTNHNVAQILREQKKDSRSMPVYNDFVIDNSYQGVIIATGYLDRVKDMPAIEKYVESGGVALILQQLQPDSIKPDLLAKLGVLSIGKDVGVSGVRVNSDFMLGAKDFAFDSPAYINDVSAVMLTPDSNKHMTAYNGLPIVWEHKDGAGKFIVYNGRERDDKNHRGLVTALISQCSEDYIYPIVNSKLFFIDDFPAPVPEGHLDRLYAEVHMDTEDFFRKVWWPQMQSNADEFNLRYTGLIIETYGNQVQGPFQPLPGKGARNNLIVYGRELLKMGGELGLHGYNHQSLAPEGYIKNEIGYTAWPSKEDMVEALQELRRYVYEAYPGYTFQTYVPPSNILSEEGHEAVKEAFPELKVYASLFTGLATEDQYFQDFVRNDDDTFEIPRVSAGHSPPDVSRWEIYNLINYKGVFSHFLHPDELFYEESKNLTWAGMKMGLERFLKDNKERYGWLEPNTASECAAKLADYLDMDYRVERSDSGITIYAWTFRQPMSFVLRTHKTISGVDGGTAERIQNDAYIITVREPVTEIHWQ